MVGDSKMSILFMMVIMSLLLGFGFLIGFIWSVKSGQYTDTVTPGARILFDEKQEGENEDSK
jgi:cbb3-type cytochrome oxidase maturation protein